jgi:hypothetical protein
MARITFSASNAPDVKLAFDFWASTRLNLQVYDLVFSAEDQGRVNGTEYAIAIEYDELGALLLFPFTFEIFEARTVAEAVQDVEDFQTLNPAWYFSDMYERGFGTARRVVQFTIGLLACADGAASANVFIGGGGSGPIPPTPTDIVTALTNGVPVTCDSFLVDDFGSMVWEITLYTAAGARQRWRVEGTHNGIAAADATATQETVAGLGPNAPSHTITTDLNGAGVAQAMRLRITAAAAGWTCTARRLVAQVAGAS